MLSLSAILTKGGLIIWSHSILNLANVSKVLEALVLGALIEGKPSGTHGFVLNKRDILVKVNSGEDTTVVAADSDLRFKWLFANDLGVILIVGYPSGFQTPYADEFLVALKKLYSMTIKNVPKDGSGIPLRFDNSVTHAQLQHVNTNSEDSIDFNSKYMTLLRSYDMQSSTSKKKAPRKFEETEQFKSTLKGSLQKPSDAKSSKAQQDYINEKNLEEKMKKLGITSGRSGRSSKVDKGESGQSRASSAENSDSSSKGGRKKNPPAKEMRSWVGGYAVDAPTVLDYSEPSESGSRAGISTTNLKELEGTAKGSITEDGFYNPLEYGKDDDDSVDESGDVPSTGGLFGSISNMFSFATTRVMSKDDMAPILDQIRQKLIQKNVAEEVASHICESVSAGVVGKKIAAFHSMATAVNEEISSCIKRILTPKTSIDILRDIRAANAAKKIYTIAFIGVNGVGKSTNLSKVCYWLLQNRLKVLVAACDTFRSGAVEQLKVHQQNLSELVEGSKIEVFDRGYGKDAAGIAREAIGYGNNNGFDVVLIDTAGRMQDNEPLMRSLSKLVTTNNPDKIIFVGEALVGNEAISQLSKFNQALRDFSGQQNPRQIDGMILTKFDTIDDKVGAALSMTYITGQPIFFIGTGQTYTDLCRLNVKSVVDCLLK